MSFLSSVKKFARSPQGRKVMREAKKLAKDPSRRRQIDDVRRRLTGESKKGRGGATRSR